MIERALLAVFAVVAALCLTLAGWQYGRAERARTQLNELRADVDRKVRLAEKDARDTENRRYLRLQEAQDAEKLAREAAQRDAAAARAAVDRLREQAQRVAAASRCPSNPEAAAGSPPAEDGPDLLADVLGRLAARSGRLAELADASRIAGQLCERAYESLTR